MTALQALLSEPIVQRVGWVLVHFVWQGAAVALGLALLLFLLRRRSANARYVAACTAIALLATLPVATFRLVPTAGSAAPATVPALAVSSPALPQGNPSTPHSGPAAYGTYGAPRASSERVPADPFAASSSASFPAPLHARLSDRIESLLPWLVFLWLIGVLALSARLLAGWVQVRSMQRRDVRPVDESWDARFARLARRLEVSRPVRLLESAVATVPIVIGWLRPVILLPARALTGLTSEQLEAVIAHELAHIRRCDYLVNLLQTAIETLLFYHPAVWWISHRIRVEREYCCDDSAVRACGNRLVYARALTELEQQRTVPAPLVLAAVGRGSLLFRIRRLIGSPSPGHDHHTGWVAGALALTTLVALAAALPLIARADDTAGKDDIKTDVPRDPVATRIDVPTDAIMVSPAFSPDGRKIAHVSDWNHNALAVYDRDTKKNTVLVPKSKGAVYVDAPVWSPDGQRVACVVMPDDDTTTVVIIPAGGGRREVIYSSKHLLPWLFDWSQDGKWILARVRRPDRTRSLVLLPVAGGEPEQLISVGWDGISATLSPDGRLIACSHSRRGHDGSSQLFLLDRVDGSRVAVTKANPRGVHWSADGQWLVYIGSRGDGDGRALWARRIKDRRPVGQPIRIVKDFKGGRVDQIIRDGTLIYTTWSGVANAVYRVQVDPATGTPVDHPVKVAGGRQGIPSPADTRRIALNGPRLGLIKTVAWDGTDERDIAMSVGIPYLYGWFPDGKHLLTGGYNDSGKRGLFRVNLETGEAEPIFTRRWFVRNARLSPDGKRIVFGMRHETSDGKRIQSIYTVPAEPGATPVLLRHEPTERSADPSWSPDGRLVAFVSSNDEEKIGRVLVVPVDGGEPKEVARHTLEEDDWMGFTAWSPSGTHILYSLKGEAWRVSAQGGEQPEHLVELDEFKPNRFIFTADGKTLLFTGTQGRSNVRAWALKNFLPEAADDASGQ